MVLPPKVRYEEMANNEFCPNLAKIFKFTLPVSWQVLKTVDYVPESVHNPIRVSAEGYEEEKS